MSDHINGPGQGPMSLLIDCDRCEMRDIECADCMVTVILGFPGVGSPKELEFDDSEARALTALANGGLVPQLRLVQRKGA